MERQTHSLFHALTSKAFCMLYTCLGLIFTVSSINIQLHLSGSNGFLCKYSSALIFELPGKDFGLTMCTRVSVYNGRCLSCLEEVIRVHGAGVTGGCEQPHIN